MHLYIPYYNIVVSIFFSIIVVSVLFSIIPIQLLEQCGCQFSLERGAFGAERRSAATTPPLQQFQQSVETKVVVKIMVLVWVP